MSKRDHRMKAQDVFSQSSFLFSEKTTFDKAFPDVAECIVEVEESGDGISGMNRKRTHRNPGQYINCSNNLCYNGGFNISSHIYDMVSKRETFREDSAFCQGNEGSPKGRRIYRKCMNFFKFNITIKYKTMPNNSIHETRP